MTIRSCCRCVAFIVGCLACLGVCRAADPPQFHPGRVIPLLGEDQQNLVPNASFECGTDGWGSVELDFLPGWYNPLNTLFGRLDPTTAADGHASLKIELGPENQPIAYNDFLNTQREPIRAPAAANAGWIEIKPGRPYRFSVAMKAAAADTPGAVGGAAVSRRPLRAARAAVDRLEALHARVHTDGRGLLRDGRARPAAGQRQSQPA